MVPFWPRPRAPFPFIERIIGDAGYQGQKMQAAVARTGTWKLQIVRRRDQHRFVVVMRMAARCAEAAAGLTPGPLTCGCARA